MLALAVMIVASVLAAGTALAVVDNVQRTSAGRNAALHRALEDLVSMRGGPPGVIAVVQRDQKRNVHTVGVADLRTGRPLGVNNRMRIASTAKAFSGAVALSLVSKAPSPSTTRSGNCCRNCRSHGTGSHSDNSSTTPAAYPITPRTPASKKPSSPASRKRRPKNLSRT